MALRIAILGVLAVVLFCALFFRLWALQVISGERYLEDAKNNQVRTFRVPAQRGTIVDRNGNVLVSNQPGTQIRLWPAAFTDRPEAERHGRVPASCPGSSASRCASSASALARGEADPLTPVVLKTRDPRPQGQLPPRAPARVPGRPDHAGAAPKLRRRLDRRPAPRLRRRDRREAARGRARTRATRPATSSARPGWRRPTTATCAAGRASGRCGSTHWAA